MSRICSSIIGAFNRNYNTNDNNSDKNIIIIRNGYWWSPTATDGHQWLLMVMRAPTMPNVGSRYSKFGFEKKKKKMHLVLKKKKMLRQDSWVPSLRQEESVSMNAGLRGRGGGEALRLFYGKNVLAILKTYST